MTNTSRALTTDKTKARPTTDDVLRVLSEVATTDVDELAPHVVGGALRDALLGRAIREVDVAVPRDAEEIARRAAEHAGTRVAVLGTHDRVYRLPTESGHVDIVPMAGTLEQDLARRDFTINALAVPLTDALADGLSSVPADKLVDLHHGIRDLRSGRLRLVRPDALDRDPLRALRAVRFASAFRFQASDETREAMHQVADRLGTIAAERLSDELRRIFGGPRCAKGVDLMEQTNILEALFPELADCRTVESGSSHHTDVLAHQINTVHWIDALTSAEAPTPHAAAALWHGLWGESQQETLRWEPVRTHVAAHATGLRFAALLHDIGKPHTRTQDSSGRTRFIGHPTVGAQLVRERLTTLRFPAELGNAIQLLVSEHLRPGQIADAGQRPTARALHRFHHALGTAVPEACVLFLADSLATVGADALLPRWPAYVEHVRVILRWHPPPSAERIRGVVDGHHLMKELGLTPGPVVGRLLAAIDEAANAGEIESPNDATDLARKLLEEWGTVVAQGC